MQPGQGYAPTMAGVESASALLNSAVGFFNPGTVRVEPTSTIALSVGACPSLQPGFCGTVFGHYREAAAEYVPSRHPGVGHSEQD